jgi:hypothetical protein
MIQNAQIAIVTGQAALDPVRCIEPTARETTGA